MTTRYFWLVPVDFTNYVNYKRYRFKNGTIGLRNSFVHIRNSFHFFDKNLFK